MVLKSISMKINNFLFVIIANIIGLITIGVISYCILEHDINSQSRNILNNLNDFTNEIDFAYTENFRDLDLPSECEIFKKNAALLIFVSSIIRSVSWVSEGVVECSSLSEGNLVLPISVYELHGPKFFYLPESPYSENVIEGEKGVFIISYKLMDDMFFNFGIHPQNIQRLLYTKDGFVDYKLFIGNYFFQSDLVLDATLGLEDFEPRLSNDLASIYAEYGIYDYLYYTFRKFGVFVFAWIMICTFGANEIFKKIHAYGTIGLKIGNGLRNKEFQPYLQPIFDRNLKLMGAEVLARWIDRDGKIILPDDFINIAEKSGQINKITKILMDKLTQKLKSIPEDKKTPLHISFNISPTQLTNVKLYTYFNSFLSSFYKENYSLVLEVTEREPIPNDNKYIDSINKFKKIGVQIALDDFGTGHCSLKYLLQMDVDYIKIDKSYVASIDNGQKIELLDNIISLCDNLHITTIAEGVENDIELNYLLEKGVDNFQGYFFDKPLSIDDFIKKYILDDYSSKKDHLI